MSVVGTDAVGGGWWVVRWGQRLVHIEADDAEDAVLGSIEALRGLGDWTGDAGALTAVPYFEHHEHARAGDFTRAVVDRTRRHRGAHPRRTRARRSR